LVITVVLPELSIKNTKATSRCIPRPQNWKIANDASRLSGEVLVKIWKFGRAVNGRFQ
jgi:hypothetical protein